MASSSKPVGVGQLPPVKELCEALGFEHASVKESNNFVEATRAWRKSYMKKSGLSARNLLQWNDITTQRVLEDMSQAFLTHRDNGNRFWSPHRSWIHDANMEFPRDSASIVALLIQLFWKQNRYAFNNSQYGLKTGLDIGDGSKEETTLDGNMNGFRHLAAAVASPHHTAPKSSKETSSSETTNPTAPSQGDSATRRKRTLISNNFDGPSESDSDSDVVIISNTQPPRPKRSAPSNQNEKFPSAKKRSTFEKPPRRTPRKQALRHLSEYATEDEIKSAIFDVGTDDSTAAEPLETAEASVAIIFHTSSRDEMGNNPQRCEVRQSQFQQLFNNKSTTLGINTPKESPELQGTHAVGSPSRHMNLETQQSGNQPLLQTTVEHSPFQEAVPAPIVPNTKGRPISPAEQQSGAQSFLQKTVEDSSFQNAAPKPILSHITERATVAPTKEAKFASAEGAPTGTRKTSSVQEMRVKEVPQEIETELPMQERETPSSRLSQTPSKTRPKTQIPLWIITREPRYTEERWDEGKFMGTPLAAFIEGISGITQRNQVEKIKLTLRAAKFDTKITVHKDAEDSWASAKKVFTAKVKAARAEARASRELEQDFDILIEPCYEEKVSLGWDIDEDEEEIEF